MKNGVVYINKSTTRTEGLNSVSLVEFERILYGPSEMCARIARWQNDHCPRKAPDGRHINYTSGPYIHAVSPAEALHAYLKWRKQVLSIRGVGEKTVRDLTREIQP